MPAWGWDGRRFAEPLDGARGGSGAREGWGPGWSIRAPVPVPSQAEQRTPRSCTRSEAAITTEHVFESRVERHARRASACDPHTLRAARVRAR